MSELRSIGGKGGRDLRQLRGEMVDRLADIAGSDVGERQLHVVVTAASRVLSHCEWDEERRQHPREMLLRLLNGDEAQLEAWLRAELAALESKKVTAA